MNPPDDGTAPAIEERDTPPAAADRDAAGPSLSRRDALRMLAASATLPILSGSAGCASPESADPPVPASGPRGTPTDPDLLRPIVSWPKQLTQSELVSLAALCDTIIPADDVSPSASAVGVPGYIDEWASAPYDWARDGLAQLRSGLAWLDGESARRFGSPFAALAGDQRNAIAEDICYLPRAKPEHQEVARFFDMVRDLTATGFYTTVEGMRDIGYVGNTPLDRFDGPPPEVLRRLGLA
jgi:hypothetical protein